MIEKLVGLEKMSLHQCQELAQKIGFDSATFDLCGPLGSMKAKWLDAYFGLFQIEGEEGFISTTQITFNPSIWCENLMPAGKEKT